MSPTPEIPSHILSTLKLKFRDTLVHRGADRVKDVIKYRDDIWEVAARSDLGDKMLSYWVTWDNNFKKYHCDCFDRHHGDSRERSLCSHVMAVIIWRRINKPDTGYKFPTVTGVVKGVK